MDKKAFYLSKGFWGLIIMAVGIFLPRYVIPLQDSVDDIIAIVGLIVAIWGRWVANAPLGLVSGNDKIDKDADNK